MNAQALFPTFPTLSNDEIYNIAPAVFAESPHAKTSPKYGFVPTIGVIETLRDEGWHVTKVQQAAGRAAGRQESNRHLVRMRHVDAPTKMAIGDSVPELVLTNSHNRTSCLTMHAGIFRFVCSNGMILADAMFDARKFRHNQDIYNDVIEGTYEVIEEVPMITESITRFRELVLDENAQQEFGNRAIELLPPAKSVIDPFEIIRPRRNEDRDPNMWNILNATQENIIKGGYVAKNEEKNSTIKRRGVTCPYKSVQLNKAVWEIASDFALELAA